MNQGLDRLGVRARSMWNLNAMTSLDPSLLERFLPVFPLPGCVLLPGGVLPLHIFESRYRLMVEDLLDQPPRRRLIAVALLRNEFEGLHEANRAPIQRVVGLGEMVQRVLLPDGCSTILIVGRERARVVEDDPTGIYRRARLELIKTEPGDMLTSVHESVDSVRVLLKEIRDLSLCDPALIDQMLNIAPSAAAMIDMSAFHLIGPHEAAIKQRIMEEERLEIRAETLAICLRKMLDTWHDSQAQPDAPVQWPPEPETN